MNKVAIVILNFMNYKESINCVDSALLQKEVDYEIVIVDNGSSNESYKELRKRYKNNALVHVIRANRNYGFAKGNNIGIRYAKEELSADFVLLLNSDTELIQEDYISILLSRYKRNVAVIGSNIIQKGGLIQDKYYAYVEFPATLYFYLELICNYCGFLVLAEKFNQLLRKKEKREILHGSCFMLTPSFFQYYNLLYSKTFLYSEEILLYIYCTNKGLTQIKTEEASILHKGKCSSRYLYGNGASKKDRYLIASFKYVVWESFKSYINGLKIRR